MPVHDWSKVDDGTFHSFHLSWVAELSKCLNHGGLPPDYYAMSEQQAAGFEPDILTLSGKGWEDNGDEQGSGWSPNSDGGIAIAEPRVALTAESEGVIYSRKTSTVTIRHVSGDRIVAVIEIVSRGNKSSKERFDSFLRKAGQFLRAGVHLLLIDLHPQTSRDPNGLHDAIWRYLTAGEYQPPAGKPFTQVTYEAAGNVRAYVDPVGLGDSLTDMPVFLRVGGCVHVPLEATYVAAFDALPKRRQVLLAI